MSRKGWINLVLVVLALTAAVGSIAALVYYANLAQNLSQHETLILGQTSFNPGSKAGMRILVRDSKNAAPLVNAQVSLSLRPQAGGAATQLYQGSTDAKGNLDVSFKIPAQTEGVQILTIETRSSLGSDKVEKPVTIKRDARILISTDKPLYQPGQTIHLRALALSTFDLKPLASQSLEITIADGKGNKVFRKTLKTSDYGSAAVDFELASEVNTGAYKISAKLDTTVSEKTVTVENYVLPKFAVKVQTDRAFYQPGQRIKGSLKADYFFGKSVAGSVVKIEGFTFDVQRVVTATVDGKTKDDGSFSFELDLPKFIAGSELDKGGGRFYLQATVTDQTNHSETSNLSLPVSQSALLIQAIPEGGTFRANVENILYILTSTPDGAPVEASLKVTVQNLNQTFNMQSGAYGLAEARIIPNASQQRLIIEARDKQGNAASKTFTFNLSGYNNETILLRPEKPVYKVGDAMKLTLLSSKPTGTAYLDIIRQKQTVSTRSMEIKDGRAEVVIDLTPDLYGTIELHAYKILTTGAIERDSRIVVVDNAAGLKINLTAGQEVYRPGDQGTLAVQVQGTDGKGAQAALGLAIVDESVFALAEQDPGFAKLYFMLEKELLQPKFDLHGYTISDLMTGSIPKGDSQLEQAVNQAAQASLAAAAKQGTFSLQANSRTENLKKANELKTQFFKGAGTLFGGVAILLPLAVLGLASASAWKRKNLGLSLLLAAFIITFILLVVMLIPLNNYPGNVSLPQRLIGVLSLLYGNNLAFLAVIAGLGALSLITLLVLAIIRKDLLLGWMLGGLLLYVGAGFGFVYSVNSSVNSASMETILVLALIAFFLMPLAYLLVSGSAALNRRPVLSLASLAFFVLLLLGGLPLFALGFVGGASAPMPGIVNDAFGGQEMRQLGVQPMMAPIPTAAPAATRVAEAQKSVGGTDSTTPTAAEPPRLRQYFPETMYWLPEAVTDASGKLNLQIPIADSITTWRVTALASTQDGRLGSATSGLRVFQDFFIDLDLPLSLTVEDQVSLPVGIFNYLTTAQTVRLEVSSAPWFELLDPAVKEVKIEPNEISVVYFRIQAKAFGRQAFKVTAIGSKMSDAIQKEVTVYPNGKQVTFTNADRLTPGKAVTVPIKLPADAIPGTQKLSVKIYPGMLSQVVEGLDSILRMPNGCFEQTSSTTYPNVLVLDYLKTTNQVAPEVQMKAEQYINLGYQRLTTFEVKSSGGFSLFGNEPADRMLTAYGLQEFSDMSRVHDVDPALLKRAAQNLYAQQDADGSWKNDRGLVHESTWQTLGNDKLPVTAYIVWSLVDAGFGNDSGTKKGLDYVREYQAQAKDPYALALVANALVAADLKAGDKLSSPTEDALNRLAGLAQRDGDKVFWASSVATFMGSKGGVGSIETTALAAYVFQRANKNPELANGALTFLIKQKDSFGTWHNTQATVLTLKALIQSVRSGAEKVNATATITLNGGQAKTLKVTPENFDVVQIVSFNDLKPGAGNQVEIKVEGQGNLMYQVAGSYYLPWESLPQHGDVLPPQNEVSIEVKYDRTQLAVNETVTVTVTVNLNKAGARAESGLIDLGLPPGFTPEGDDLANLVAKYKALGAKYTGPAIQRYETTGRQILIYASNLAAGQPLTFSYRLRAKFPLAVSTPASSAYDYYNPGVSGEKAPQGLVVKP